MKTITLSKGKVTIVDDFTYAWANRFTWQLHNNRYAARKDGNKTIYLHRCIVHAEKYEHVDHANGNCLDNRMSNLRLCNRSQNLQNQKKSSKNTSGYKGVSWSKGMKKWRVRLTLNKKEILIGYYDDKEEAAKAYDREALHYFGEFAKFNFGRKLYIE